MKKEIFAMFCVLTILASTAPIFAVDATTAKPVHLSDVQNAKLNIADGQLIILIAGIETLKTTYKNTNKAKGLLIALNQYEKQATKLDNAILKYKANPTAPANAKIKTFQKKTKELLWKVSIKEKILKKIKPVKPKK
jgi:hypothetical protein